ncbi:uncharacterized protein LTR77_002768 [Saxophila tyrrhenica]|uniref:F-box domain-containing protein n=1 Tax=Saxophila tyrrhenica TaxID=1690608 RepID=A0AAV9PH83_9PEZI|nr:hypothetical protein LTR77_002768 [Saxophila tyrrhenica]
MVGKRAREDGAENQEPPYKRVRPSKVDHLSRLSDELTLRVLSFLPISELLKCQRLSHKYHNIGADSQLWKSHYYNRFVRPRASRLPGIKDIEQRSENLHFASKASRWLDDEHLVRGGRKTNWKRQYKLRHNWSKGSCAVDEIAVAEQATVPPLVVQLHDGIIYTADQDSLRAWSAKDERKLLAQRSFTNSRHGPPTSLAVDTTGGEGSTSRLIIGFENGAFGLFYLDSKAGQFTSMYQHEASSNGVISVVTLVWPYAVTMTATQLLSIYSFRSSSEDDSNTKMLDPPRLLHSLRSRTVLPPLSTSLRTNESGIVVSIAYSMPTYLSGWTVGIQEVRIDETGKLLESRLASAIDQHYRSLAFASPPMLHHLPGPAIGALATSTATELRHIHTKPTSLSYTHPYLLVSHPDNTLTLYLVNSTAEALSISAGSRLWGHTSSVSGAHVGGRGKAVSVSRRGDELRIWELEGGFASSAAKRRLATGDLSVQLRPAKRPPPESSQAGLDLVNTKDGEEAEASELTLTRGWIGFDEENVVVLKEQSQGRQALVVYDFT